LLDDPARLERALREAVTASRTQLLRLVVNRFEPEGVTAVALLAESHLAIHTWPSAGYAAADLFTCSQKTDPEAGCRRLAQGLEAESFELEKHRRGRKAADLLATSA